MNDQFIFLTWLTQRLGSKSRWLKCIWSVSSSAYFQRSRGEFDQILWWFMINPAPIGSQLRLYAGDHDELRILLKNRLIPSWFNQELSYKEEEHRFIGNFPRKMWAVWLRGDGLTATIAQSSWATIPWCRKNCPSDLPERILMHPCVVPRLIE